MTPVLQTSANVSGEDPPSGFDEIDPEILAVADLAIDGGGVRGEPSTVIDLGELEETGDWSLLREGAFSVAEVAARLDLD
jgi:tRNA A37 threonylcarbamoyladenosine synthetase subunit TsaC/SUA5/YrdC